VNNYEPVRKKMPRYTWHFCFWMAIFDALGFFESFSYIFIVLRLKTLDLHGDAIPQGQIIRRFFHLPGSISGAVLEWNSKSVCHEPKMYRTCTKQWGNLSNSMNCSIQNKKFFSLSAAELIQR
jgi:hypothetical protein